MEAMKTILWVLDQGRREASVGILEVMPVILLKPWRHIDMAADRLQELITESDVTSNELWRMVYDAMDPEGISV